MLEIGVEERMSRHYWRLGFLGVGLLFQVGEARDTEPDEHLAGVQGVHGFELPAVPGQVIRAAHALTEPVFAHTRHRDSANRAITLQGGNPTSGRGGCP